MKVIFVEGSADATKGKVEARAIKSRREVDIGLIFFQFYNGKSTNQSDCDRGNRNGGRGRDAGSIAFAVCEGGFGD